LDLIIAPSRGILDETAADLGALSIPLVWIPNVVDLRRASAGEKAAPAATPPALVAMGRFVSWKRFDLAIEAVARLPRGSVRLDLIGDGPERGSLERLARERGIADWVRFHGYQTNPFPLLRNASIGILPSEFEPFGNVIIEMFSAGLPVIAFDVDYGPREIIRDGSNGILVRGPNPAALAEAMAALLGDPEAIAGMGEQARKDAETGYTVQRAVSGYEACFARLKGGALEGGLPC
ncbi:MAG TPA: glycosyltransferase, partial [Candidatus Polarisedimenticolia bacterium]|nr:glycosyltransferase [Candidatus Polarisedimenticolia bacterium]